MAPRGAHRDRHNRRGHNTIVLHSCRKPVLGVCVPATDAAVLGRPSRCRWSAPGRPREKLHVIPSGSAPAAQKRWNQRPRRVWRWAVVWVRLPVERRRLPLAPRRGVAVVRRVPLFSERRHRPLVVFTGTIGIPGASAAAPEFLPSHRPLADPVTTCRAAGWGVREAGWKHE